jgi:hypothetical protein
MGDHDGLERLITMRGIRTTAARTLRDLRSVREIYALAVNGVRKEILDEVPEAGAVPVA